MDFQQDFNRHVQAAIAHTNDADKQKKLRELLEETDNSGDVATMSEEEPSDFSGGGGTTNPTQPGTKPKLP